MKALVAATVLLVAEGRAAAESPVLGRADGAWFAGASVQYVRDGRAGRFGNHDHEGPAGMAYGVEGGLTLLPWLSLSLTGRFSSVGEEIYTDPGTADFSERQLRIGPRIDLWPLPGRIRLGASVVRSWRWSETFFHGSRLGGPQQLVTNDTAYNQYELQLGVVPLRWHGFELELTGSFSREPSERLTSESRILSTFSVGLGLRWRTGCPPQH